VFEQKKTKQDEQKIVSSSIESPEVRENDPLEPYRPHIDKFDLTEEQKLELIGAIFSIAHMVLDAKFGQIKDTLSAEKPVDEEAVSINGMRHEN
jgi:hypothetical protein